MYVDETLQDPTPVVFTVLLQLSSAWKQVFSIPLGTVRLLYNRPFRYLLFIACRVWGPGSEGIFRKNAIDGPQVDVDEIPVQATGEILLYFVCTNSLPLRFPDLSCLIDRSPTETDDGQTPRGDSTFRARIQARDGSCISSQRIADDSDAQACHCIPFVKGNAYLRGLNRYLQVTTDGVSGIDDTRNGLLLVANVHKKWADHALGLLLVPNELLLLEQIPPSAADNFSNPLPTPPTQCLVVHHLKTLPSATHRTVPPNCIARYETTNEAVPAYLLDYVYVSQILINFGKHWVFTYSVQVEADLEEEGTSGEGTSGDTFSGSDWEEPERSTELDSLSKRDANPRRPSGEDAAATNGKDEAFGSTHNWQVLTVLGTRTDPRLQEWRRGLASV